MIRQEVLPDGIEWMGTSRGIRLDKHLRRYQLSKILNVDTKKTITFYTKDKKLIVVIE